MYNKHKHLVNKISKMTAVLKDPTNNEKNLSKEPTEVTTEETLFTQMINGNFSNLDFDNYNHIIRYNIGCLTSIGFDNEDTRDKMEKKLIDNEYATKSYYHDLDHYSNHYRLRVWITKKKILKELNKWGNLGVEYTMLHKYVANNKSSVDKLYLELDIKNNKIPTESTQLQFCNYLKKCIKLEKLESQILKHTKYLKSLEKNYDIDSKYFACIKDMCDTFHIE